MKFFKVFNLLHRRTKSATFVSGITPITVDSASAPINLRSSSFSLGLGCRNSGSLSLFDLVTENPPPVPLTFNHTVNSTDRMLGVWRPRRFSDRNSLASIQSSMNKECARLSEAVNFWILEYTKVQTLFRECHEELKSERQKTAMLAEKLQEEKRGKAELRALLHQYENSSSEEGFSGDSSTSLRAQNQVVLYPREHLPNGSSDGNYLGESSKPRTLDEYACALRMTLTTRKELRDQKKVTKFWKNVATAGGQQDTITPSVSNISSLLEVMSEDRQAAVQALISRRGMSKQAETNNHSSELAANAGTTEDNVLEIISHGASNTIPSLSNTAISHLGPLASESMKQEVNLLFGSSSSTKWLSSSRSRRSLSLGVSPSTSFKGGLSGSLSLNIESFDDISTIFQRAFGLESRSKRDVAHEINHGSLAVPEGFGFPDNLPGDQGLIASSSSSCLPSSLASSYSQTWVSVDSANPANPSESESSVLRPITNTSYHSLKFASKECTARRSWQRYVAKTTLSNQHKSDEELPLKDIPIRRSTEGKENGGFSMSLPAFKRKPSRLPIPSMKSGN